MNLFSYIDKYGGYTFSEKEFNDLDNAIFASLSYLSLYGMVSSDWHNKITIKEVGNRYFEFQTRERNITSVKQAMKMLRYIKDTKRYGNLFLYNYIYEENSEQQFSAVTIEVSPELVYVSFEGTDHLISGWKEDFMLSYMFPVNSQRKAIEYVNKNFSFRNKKIILGGHSKGGNLALVAGMYANIWVRRKIIRVYNNDGPGLLWEQLNSVNYRRVRAKLVHIVPDSSVIGLLLYHSSDYKVVKSFRKGLWSHDLYTWVVKDDSFVKGELNSFSKTFDKELEKWLEQYDNEERETFVFSLFSIFERANVDSLIKIMDNKKLILQLIAESKEISDKDRKMLKEIVNLVVKCFRNVKQEELMSIFEKN